MADFTRVRTIFNASDPEGTFGHGFASDSNYIYLGACTDGGNGVFGEMYRMDKADLANPLNARVTGPVMGLQGCVSDGTNVFVSVAGVDGLTTYSCISRLNTSFVKQNSVKILWGGPCQNICIGVDSLGTNCVYLVGGPLIGMGARVAKVYRDLTFDSGYSVFAGPSTRHQQNICFDSSDKALYVVGKVNTPDDGRGSITKLYQVTVGGHATIAWAGEVLLSITASNSIHDVWFFSSFPDPTDTSVLWVCGSCRNTTAQAGEDGVDGLLVKLEKDQGGSNDLSVSAVYRVHQPDVLYFRFGSIHVEGDNIFLGSICLPHGGLGSDDYLGVQYAHTVCLDRSDPTTVNWCRRICSPSNYGQNSFFYGGSIDTNHMAFSGWSDKNSPSGYWSATIAKVDKAAGTLVDMLFNSTGTLKETNQTSNTTCTDITADCTITYPTNSWSRSSGTNPETDDILTWASPTTSGMTTTDVNIDSTILVDLLEPNGDSSIALPNPNPSSNTHWDLVSGAGEPDGTTTQVYSGNGSTWYTDLYTLPTCPTYVENIKKVEIVHWRKYAATGPQNYLKTAYKFGSGSLQESTAIACTSTWTEGTYDITSVTGAPTHWSQSDISNLKIGVSCRGNGTIYPTGITYIYLKVTWEAFLWIHPFYAGCATTADDEIKLIGNFIPQSSVSASSAYSNVSMIGNLKVDGAGSASSAENFAIIRNGGDFTLQDSGSASSADNGSLMGDFIIANAGSASSADNCELSAEPIHNFEINNSGSASSADNVSLIGNFIPQGSASASSADNVSLIGDLIINGSGSSTSADNCVIIFNGGEFINQYSGSATSADNMALTRPMPYTLNPNVFVNTGDVAVQCTGLQIPVWDTGSRPPPKLGLIGFNVAKNAIEIYDGYFWV